MILGGIGNNLLQKCDVQQNFLARDSSSLILPRESLCSWNNWLKWTRACEVGLLLMDDVCLLELFPVDLCKYLLNYTENPASKSCDGECRSNMSNDFIHDSEVMFNIIWPFRLLFQEKRCLSLFVDGWQQLHHSEASRPVHCWKSRLSLPSWESKKHRWQGKD